MQTTTKLASLLAAGAALLGGCEAVAIDDSALAGDVQQAQAALVAEDLIGDDLAGEDRAARDREAPDSIAGDSSTGELDAQGMMSVDGILDMCLNISSPWNEFHECIFDLDTQSITHCSPDLSGSVQMLAQQPAQGLVVEVDLDGWDAMLVAAVADDVQDYAFHIGNDPTNNGWAGGSSQYDSEAHLFGNGLHVYRNDLGGSTRAAALGNAIPNPTGSFCSTQNGAFCATVKDGYFRWLREDPTAPNGASAMEVTDPHIFRVDPLQGANDSKVYVGFESVVQVGANRTGTDLQSEVRIVLLR